MRYSIFVLLFVCIMGFSATVHAQFNVAPATDVNVSMVPENPGPNEKVTVSLTSFGTNIDAANITWRVNGKTQKTGTGQKTFQFITGNVGTKTTLDIVIISLEGETIAKNYVINPSTVDLMWQSQGYVPPFYKGKAMFSYQNRVTIIAMPHIPGSNGVEISPNNLIYQWKKDGTVIDDASGFGKNAYTLVGSIISRPMNISVNVTSPDGDSTGFANLDLNPTAPSLIFYAKNPIYGIQFQKALSNTLDLGTLSEVNVVGEPFFFGITSLNSADITYKWEINGAPIQSYLTPYEEVFRKPEGASGTSNISLSITNENKILQYTSGSFNLSFEK